MGPGILIYNLSFVICHLGTDTLGILKATLIA
jgi:hypothetical protein